MKAIVHIGTEKTGSTSIQEFLFKNRKRLIKAGYYFIQSAGQTNNRALPAFCIADDKRDHFYETMGISSLPARNQFKSDFLKTFQIEMASIPKNAHTVIISSEHFHSTTNTEDEIKNLKTLLAPYFSDINILCFLRPQAATCASLYSTAIRVGNSPYFQDFLRRCKPDNIYYNYDLMLSNWEKVFGRASLKISIFCRDSFLNEDLLDDFTEKLDPALVGNLDKNISIENESLSYAGQVLGLAVNKALSEFPQGTAIKDMRDTCQEIIYDKCRGTGRQPSSEEQRTIYFDFVDSNEKVRQKFFPEKSVLFPPAFKEAGVDRTVDSGFIESLTGVLDVIIDGQIEGVFPKITVSRLPDSYAETLRDSAVKLEKEDLKLAHELMVLAHKIRPKGTFIKRKLDEYRQKLNR